MDEDRADVQQALDPALLEVYFRNKTKGDEMDALGLLLDEAFGDDDFLVGDGVGGEEAGDLRRDKGERGDANNDIDDAFSHQRSPGKEDQEQYNKEEAAGIFDAIGFPGAAQHHQHLFFFHPESILLKVYIGCGGKVWRKAEKRRRLRLKVSRARRATGVFAGFRCYEEIKAKYG